MLLALACSWATLQLLATDWPWLAAVPAVVALLSMLAAFRLVPADPPTVADRRARRMPTPRQRWMGIAALVLAVILAAGEAIHMEQAPYIDLTLLLYPFALLLLWFDDGWLRGQSVHERMHGLGMSLVASRREIVLISLITGLSLLFRLWVIVQYPLLHGSEADEVDTALSAWTLVHSTGPWPLYQTSASVAFFQPIAASFALFGTGEFSLRLPLMIESTLLIPAFYVLARQFVSAVPALCGTCLLACAYWPLMMSLWAFGWVNGAVFQALGLGLLAYAFNRQSVTAAACGGGILAGCLYCYAVSRVLVVPGFVFIAAAMVCSAYPVRVRLSLLASSCLGFLALAAAFVGTAINVPGQFSSDSSINMHDFLASWHQHPVQALGSLLQPAANLLDTVLATPRIGGGYRAMRVAQGGLLDTVTATLVLLGLLYAVAYGWRARNLLMLSTVLVVFGVSAAVQAVWLDTYRLAGAVPALYLAAVLVLARGIAALPSSMRWLPGVLIVVTIAVTGADARHVANHLADCGAMLAPGEPLSRESDEGFLMAERVNALGSTDATFVVSPNFQIWLYYWLYRVPPVQYDPRSGPPDDPSHWSLMSSAPGTTPTAPGAANFWPPAVGRGQTAITYIMPDKDSIYLLPLLQRTYPQGTLEPWQNSVCPAFTITAYTLTAQQIAQGPKA